MANVVQAWVNFVEVLCARTDANVAKDERQHCGQGRGSEDGPRQRGGRVDRQNLVEICGIEE